MTPKTRVGIKIKHQYTESPIQMYKEIHLLAFHAIDVLVKWEKFPPVFSLSLYLARNSLETTADCIIFSKEKYMYSTNTWAKQMRQTKKDDWNENKKHAHKIKTHKCRTQHMISQWSMPTVNDGF